MKFIYDDGGRSEAGYKGDTGDCVCRAIAITLQKPYAEIYSGLLAEAAKEKVTAKKTKRSHPRTGVYKSTIRKYCLSLGLVWVPVMRIGSGCTVHLRDGELPAGRLVVCVSKHCVAVVDGVIHDTFDCSRGGLRCVYGYFYKPAEAIK